MIRLDGTTAGAAGLTPCQLTESGEEEVSGARASPLIHCR